MKNESELIERKESSELKFDGVMLHVYKDKITLPNGNTSGREFIRHNGAVGIVPLTDDGKVIMERQFRYPIYEVITEIPAGKLDTKEEDRLSAAKRELREETGYTASEWICLGDYYPAAAYSDERLTLYLARGLKLGEQKLDPDEFLYVEAVPLEDLVNAVLNGEITDGKTQVALLKADYYLKGEKR